MLYAGWRKNGNSGALLLLGTGGPRIALKLIYYYIYYYIYYDIDRYLGTYSDLILRHGQLSGLKDRNTL